MIALSYFTYIAENPVEMVAKKRGRGELLWNSCFFRRPVSDVIQCLEISGIKWYCLSSHLQLGCTENLFTRAWVFHCRQPLIAGMYLMMSVNTVIPPGKKGESTFYEVIIWFQHLLLLLIVKEDLTEACWYVDGQINYLIDWTNEEKKSYVQDCILFPCDYISKGNQCCISTCINNNDNFFNLFSSNTLQKMPNLFFNFSCPP